MSAEEFVTDEVDDTATSVGGGSIAEVPDEDRLVSNLIQDDPFSEETVQTINDLMSRWKMLWPIPEGNENMTIDSSSVAADSIAT